MIRRMLWLGGALVAPLMIAAVLFAGIAYARPLSPTKTVIINEWSQGAGGSQEWIELLVMSPTADLRGWDVGDSTAGDLTFATHSLWANVPAGTLIVIYNGTDKDSMLPADDEDAADFVLVVPHNHPDLFEGSWPALSNSTAEDNPQLRNQLDEVVHNFSVEPGSALHAAASQAAAYQGQTPVAVADSQLWATVAAAVATPSEGNSVANTSWIQTLRSQQIAAADLVVQKESAATATAGETLMYTITVRNDGPLSATAVVLTDFLPEGITYLSDNSGYAHNINGNEVSWLLGTVYSTTTFSFELVASVNYDQIGIKTNRVSISTASLESSSANNMATASTTIQSTETAVVLIDAVLYQGQAKGNGQGDEAVLLRNVSTTAADLSGWQLSDGSSAVAILPTNTILAADGSLWLAADAQAFAAQFGHWPDLAVKAAGTAAALSGSWPGFADSGDEVILSDQLDKVIDVLVYEAGDTSQIGWEGVAVEPYKINSTTAVRGQILYRQRDQLTGLPVVDTDKADDWAQDTTDVINGRKIRYPGWFWDEYFTTTKLTDTAVITVGVAPDNAYETIAQTLNHAQESIQIELHTFENVALGNILVAAAQRGVEVTVLLEGSPPGGIDDQQRYICQQLNKAGGRCWYMINDDANDIYDRYTYIHAKFAIIDGRQGLIASENFSPNSLPYDNKSDGSWGRRGVVLVINSSEVVTYLQTLFAADFDPANHHDLVPYTASDTTYGAPPPGFKPVTVTGGVTYTTRYQQPEVLKGAFAFELVQSPENSLRTADGLLGLLGQAAVGDTILVQQLTERPYWGDNFQDDPNPRVLAYLEAARRGASVWVLLDSFFDNPTDPLSNSATCDLLNGYAYLEKIDIRCRVGNPAGMGIHNKMVLAHIGGQGYAHIGSINGTEQSHKGNRELAIQVASNELYDYLAEMLYRDWPYQLFAPFVAHDLRPWAQSLLISEVLYDPSGPDGSEFIELVNPTSAPILLSNYTVGDAWQKTEFADVRRFPADVWIPSHATVVIAQQAVAFEEKFGRYPDFEILETDVTVPNLIDDPAWGDPATFLQLGNLGDVVLVRDLNEQLVDGFTYGEKQYEGIVACPAVASGHSLRRNPYWQDTDDCARDFEDWPIPDPGFLPN